MQEEITIKKSEYKELLAESDLLNRLLAHGVDNWEGYEDALNDKDNE